MWKRRSKRRAARLLPALALALAVAAVSATDKKKPKTAPQALLFGSVFQENGFLLRGARVVISGGERGRVKKETLTDLQGEFAVRLPAGQATYSVEVSAPGFAAEKKTVQIAADERVDLTFRLSPLK